MLMVALSGCSSAHTPPLGTESLPALPAAWLDLPGSPVVAVRSEQGAVLENRTDIEIWKWTIGCVREVSGVASVVGALWEVTTSGGWVKGYPQWDDLRTVNRLYADPELYIRMNTPIRPCQPDERVTITAVRSRDGYRWSAEGAGWPRERANIALYQARENFESSACTGTPKVI